MYSTLEFQSTSVRWFLCMGNEFLGERQNYRLGAVDIPHFRDFTDRGESPETQTQDVLSKLREIRKCLFKSGPHGAFKSHVPRRENGGILFTTSCLFFIEILPTTKSI